MSLRFSLAWKKEKEWNVESMEAWSASVLKNCWVGLQGIGMMPNCQNIMVGRTYRNLLLSPRVYLNLENQHLEMILPVFPPYSPIHTYKQKYKVARTAMGRRCLFCITRNFTTLHRQEFFLTSCFKLLHRQEFFITSCFKLLCGEVCLGISCPCPVLGPLKQQSTNT